MKVTREGKYSPSIPYLIGGIHSLAASTECLGGTTKSFEGVKEFVGAETKTLVAVKEFVRTATESFGVATKFTGAGKAVLVITKCV